MDNRTDEVLRKALDYYLEKNIGADTKVPFKSIWQNVGTGVAAEELNAAIRAGVHAGLMEFFEGMPGGSIALTEAGYIRSRSVN